MMSSLRGNLERAGTETNIHFFFGSAIHFALEDYHGWNKFGDPRRALQAYFKCFKKSEMPDGAEESFELGLSMLTYYLQWLPSHNKAFEFETLWLNKDNDPVAPFSVGAEPATEIRFLIDLDIQVLVNEATGKIIKPFAPVDDAPYMNIVRATDYSPEQRQYCKDNEWLPVSIVPIKYHGTVDRIVVDKYDRWWLLDYKTAKSADTNKLDTDDQISAYMWAIQKHFGRKIEGFVYLQLTKSKVQAPRRVKAGTLSIDKKQATTHGLFKQELINDYGSVAAAPSKHVEALNAFAETESPEGNKFIRWDLIKRNAAQLVSTEAHIKGEIMDMINQDLYLYPTPTRDCIWDCPLRDVCLSMDDGREAEATSILENQYQQRPRHEDGNIEEWRENLVYPNRVLGIGKLEEFGLDLPEDELVIIGMEKEEEVGFVFEPQGGEKR